VRNSDDGGEVVEQSEVLPVPRTDGCGLTWWVRVFPTDQKGPAGVRVRLGL
jgi:hypothetical protein